MTVGLVLSGGGMRGIAHIGAIKALEEYKIPITHVAGSSAGAIVGAFYAYGYDYEKILEFFESVQLLDITKYAINKPGFIDAEKFYNNFKSYLIEDSFSALKKELYITATNILDGKLNVFNKGELIKPLIASSAIPGVFAPVEIDSSYYVDGGVLNNFPVTLLKPKCDIIIGVYVNGYQTIDIKHLKHSHNVIERALKLKSVKEDMVKFEYCDVIIQPEGLDKYGTFDKKNSKAIFKLGYEAAKNALLKSNTLKAKFDLKIN
ncbi:MAG: patatin-like phospholipase family protein [Winogradskyella sp.]|uniref:patatin-like phospholipase family protein n=1 Tax=Winogradskyella sp. TaxID=1883156 RepID=UPI0017FDD682|nr:patatin-like phospholipase family protein [Winogradskyella sp.]MBT8244453.1 patatin-like phospholipase family protein [Winogradskyella sp.]NNK22405.1 patatin-like phospholipase family protein [Winogradskyella sp.]